MSFGNQNVKESSEQTTLLRKTEQHGDGKTFETDRSQVERFNAFG